MVNLAPSLENILGIVQMVGALGDFALPIARINLGTTIASCLGLLQMVGALGYFFAWSFASCLGLLQMVGALGYFFTLPVAQRSHRFFASFILLLSGRTLFFDGWRLDPIMQFQQLLISVLISYLIFLDLKKSTRSTQQ